MESAGVGDRPGELEKEGLVSLEDRSFAGPTAVGRYWIAHAEGFAVESSAGRPLGTVESVAVDPRTAETMLVLARGLLRGRRQSVVPARRVASVLPWSRRIVLARTPRPARAARARTSGARQLGRASGQLRGTAAWARPYGIVVLALAAAGLRRAAAGAGALARLAPVVAAAAAVQAARALKAYGSWLALTVPQAARSGRAWLSRKRRDLPVRRWSSSAASFAVGLLTRLRSFARSASGRVPRLFATRR